MSDKPTADSPAAPPPSADSPPAFSSDPPAASPPTATVSEEVQIKYEETDSPQASSGSPDNTHQSKAEDASASPETHRPSAEGASVSPETHQHIAEGSSDDASSSVRQSETGEGEWITPHPKKLSKRAQMAADNKDLAILTARRSAREYNVL
jgi:hypothetical protein